MALYQPSNITPSVFAGVGESTVAAADPINISWQVNGTSALVSCGITVYQNNNDSTVVHVENSITANCPFYGTDAKGNVTMYTYAPGSTWASWGLTDGEEYKLAITQRYMAGSIPISITQYSPQVFLTRTAPELAINTFTTPISSITQTFTATYSQAQGDALNSVRWTLYNNTTSTMLEDTGTINTGVLSYTYSGFMPNNNYTITCIIETENGVSAEQAVTFSVAYDEPAASGDVSVSCETDGGLLLQWGKPVNIPGTASAANGYYINTSNTMPLKLLNGYNVTWDTVNGENMSFNAPYTLAWSGIAPQNAMYINRVGSNATNSPLDGEVYCVAINPAGTLAVIGGTFSGYAKLYSISDGNLTYISDILSNSSAALSGAVYCADFSADGQNLVLGGIFENYAKIYNVSSTTVTWLEDIPSQNGLQHYLDGPVNAVKFMQVTGTTNLVVGGSFTACAKYYSIQNHDTITFVQNITKSNGTTLTATVRNIAAYSSYFVLCSDYDSGLWIAGSVSAVLLYLFSQRYGVDYDSIISADFTNDGTYLACATNQQVSLFEYGTANWNLIGNIKNFIQYNPVPIAVQYVEYGNQIYLLIAGQYSTTAAYPHNIQSFIYQYPINSNGLPGSRVPIYSGNNLEAFTGRIASIKASTSGKVMIAGGTVPDYAQYFAFGENNYTIMSLNDGDLELQYSNNGFEVYISGSLVGKFPYYSLGYMATVIIRPTSISVQYYDNTRTVLLNTMSVPLALPLPNITEIQLFGFQQCRYVYVTSDISHMFSTQDPTYDADTLFLARFRDGFQAGTISPSGVISNALYRISDSETVLLGILPTTNTYLKDYGIASRTTYTYQLYYVTDNIFSAAVSSSPVSYQLNGYTLIEAQQDNETPTIYHVVNTWRFVANLNAGSVSNNNSPTFLQNFTPYRIKQPSSQMGKSGTLSALINVPNNGVYSDTAAQMEALYQLSQTTNTLFLKDMKGNIYMIAIAGPITQEINNKTLPMQVTVSIPWEEIGNVKGLSIIQYQDNPNWNIEE